MKLKTKNILLDDEKWEVTVNGKLVDLSFKEFNLLKMFLKKEGRVLTRSEIMDVWEDEKEYILETNIVEVYITYLRKKIGKEYIKTIRSIGYKLMD